jgi:hypothetical protein
MAEGDWLRFAFFLSWPASNRVPFYQSGTDLVVPRGGRLWPIFSSYQFDVSCTILMQGRTLSPLKAHAPRDSP